MPGVEELGGGDPEVEVVENARMKAGAVGRDGLVIACDTDVALDGRALGSRPMRGRRVNTSIGCRAGRTRC